MTERNCRLDTEANYPEKISLEEFVREIKEHIDIFYKNMVHLRSKGKYEHLNSDWAEEWMGTLTSWMEMEHKE